MQLVGRGRAADVYAIGEGRVLRRYRTPHPGATEREATVMRFLGEAGVPVPAVHTAAGDDLVMEHIEGRSMLDQLLRRPWRARRVGSTLADLHNTLHRVQAPEDLPLPRLAPGDCVLHLDFHPDNVLVENGRSVIIDWTNAALGPAEADVATTWVLLVTASPDDTPLPLRPIAWLVRRRLVAGYLAGVRHPSTESVVTACMRRLEDPNTRPAEIDRVRAFAAAAAAR